MDNLIIVDSSFQELKFDEMQNIDGGSARTVGRAIARLFQAAVIGARDFGSGFAEGFGEGWG